MPSCPTAVAQWIRHWSAEPKDAGSLPAMVAVFSGEGGSQKCLWVELSPYLEMPR